MMSIKQFVKDWTLPVAIAVGTIVYLTFYFVPQLDTAGETLGAVVDTIFPMMVFCTYDGVLHVVFYFLPYRFPSDEAPSLACGCIAGSGVACST